jgi:hypothetical protein
VSDWSDLPGAHLVLAGLKDAARGEETPEALLVTIGATRLRRAGIEVAETLREGEAAELRLYRYLRRAGVRDAFSRYNALLRELVSFERAIEQRRGAERRRAAERP